MDYIPPTPFVTKTNYFSPDVRNFRLQHLYNATMKGFEESTLKDESERVDVTEKDKYDTKLGKTLSEDSSDATMIASVPRLQPNVFKNRATNEKDSTKMLRSQLESIQRRRRKKMAEGDAMTFICVRT